MIKSPIRYISLSILIIASTLVAAQRTPVMNQINLPHNYYFRELYLPQLTGGPSSVAWTPDGKSLLFSQAGCLWKHNLGNQVTEQLTDAAGYDYQPDVSPDGQRAIFVRYNGVSTQLMLIDLITGKTKPLTENNDVNLEPRWAPSGNQIAFVSTLQSGHFLLYTAKVSNDQLSDVRCLTPDRKSLSKRYYYSEYDHAINPVWSRDGKEVVFVSNKEIVHGTGDMVRMNVESQEVKTIHHEETNWKTKPDVSPDGTRIVYSSYLGRNWHQLWLLPIHGGSPMPITYGDYDNTSPRWSPDGKQIAFVSNRDGNTSLWILSVFDGTQRKVTAKNILYQHPHTQLALSVHDENGKVIPARVSITDSRGKSYAPADAFIQADDSRYPEYEIFEQHYFHSKVQGAQVEVPMEKITIRVSHGPAYETSKTEVDMRSLTNPLEIVLKRKQLPGTGQWWSGDLHVHMNYGGTYRNTPENLALQAAAEGLDFVFNLIVNKEQRIPDASYFSANVNAANEKSVLLNGQEFHTSFWGHLGILDLNDHIILPGYSGYPQTAVESLFPHNGFVADRAHEQNAIVGYVHPFEQSEVFPDQSENLFNELPIDMALGKVNYYELIGFADHKASETVWYQLLNCGFHIPAGAGTDAMANYASLRGPVGLNRVYVNTTENIDHHQFLKKVAEGKSFVTNGPLLGFSVEGKMPGDSISIPSKDQHLSYTAFVRSPVPVDHVEVVWNGEVIAAHNLMGTRRDADIKGSIKVKGSGWLLLRVWNDKPHPDLPDLYPFASTNPVYVNSPLKNARQAAAGSYFLKWIKRIEAKTGTLPFRNPPERDLVLKDITTAESFYQKLIKD